MAILKERKTYYTIFSTGIFGVLAFLTLDISGFMSKISFLFSINTSNSEDLLMFFDIIIKVLLSILLFVIYLLSIAIIWNRSKKFKKVFSLDKIVSYFRKKKMVHNLKVFGYSLSFIEDLRFYIDKNKFENLTVELYCPSKAFIQAHFVEDKPISTRVETLKGRIHEWQQLLERKRIKDLQIYFSNSVPIEYGIIINDEEAYISNYNWEFRNKKLHLIKQPRTERNMFRVSSKDKNVWSVIFSNIILKKVYDS